MSNIFASAEIMLGDTVHFNPSDVPNVAWPAMVLEINKDGTLDLMVFEMHQPPTFFENVDFESANQRKRTWHDKCGSCK